MSVIPKIKVGMPKRREKINLNFDCSTTANIGTIQPTMCREMVPNESFHVKVSSLVRLLALNVPTFGRMSLRHYHTFVPYKSIYAPFEAMLTGQHFVDSNGSKYIPTTTPFFTMDSIVRNVIMNYSIVTAYKVDADGYFGDPVTFEPESETKTITEQLAEINGAWTALRAGSNLFGSSSPITNAWNKKARGGFGDDSCGYLNLGNWAVVEQYTTDTIVFDPVNKVYNVYFIPGGSSVVTPEGADIITGSGDYRFCFKFKAPAKRFRQIMIGLGYQFSPYDAATPFSPLKLLAYYKAWFSLFSPIRDRSFQDTKCYSLCKQLEDYGYIGRNIDTYAIWANFLNELVTECFYYLPMDYFSMAQTDVNQPNSDIDFQISSPTGRIKNYNDPVGGSHINEPWAKATIDDQSDLSIPLYPTVNVSQSNNSSTSPLAIKMAMRLLTFANKNSIIGRSIREYLKAHYGVTGDADSEFNNVVRIGASRTNVQISDVMATAETKVGDSVMPLGGFAGKGIGYGDSETFDFTAKEFGVWITFSVIVPESGYYQGYLRENRHLNRYDFFANEFDALGYQVLERGELIDDYNCDGPNWNPRDGNDFSRLKGFGFVPRYSEYKVGRNIVNGDLSLIGMYNSMAPYTLDRRIPAGSIYKGHVSFTYDSEHDRIANFKLNYRVDAPGFVPDVVHDGFRRLDHTDHLGQYNRIFTYGRNDIDHFIIHNVFDVSAIAPMKSLTSSFDTVQEGDKTIDVTHS